MGNRSGKLKENLDTISKDSPPTTATTSSSNLAPIQTEPERSCEFSQLSRPTVEDTKDCFSPRSPCLIKETSFIEDESSDEEQERRVNQYILHEVIGRGAFSEVWRVSDSTTGSFFAMKEMSKRHLKRIRYGSNSFALSGGPNAGDDVKREISILKSTAHPNIIKLYEVMDDPRQDMMFMVFEYACHGPVVDLNKEEKIPEDKISKYALDIALGIEYLHNKNIIHRDIKPDNLLLSHDDHIKIIDFGVSEKLSSSPYVTRSVGSVAFWAPEMCKADSVKYEGKPLDIWAFGITLYSLFYGRVPFITSTPVELFDAIITDPLNFPLGTNDPSISSVFRGLLEILLEKNPSQRPKIQLVKEHPFLAPHNSFDTTPPSLLPSTS